MNIPPVIVDSVLTSLIVITVIVVIGLAVDSSVFNTVVSGRWYILVVTALATVLTNMIVTKVMSSHYASKDEQKADASSASH